MPVNWAVIKQDSLQPPERLDGPLEVEGARWLPGRGAKPARLLVAGQNPGGEELLQSKVFVGPSGKLLESALGQTGLKELSTYITNVVKFGTFNNEAPKAYEIRAGQNCLLHEIDEVNPEVILILGACALEAVAGRLPGNKPYRLAEQRGEFFTCERFNGIRLFATWHPAYILRQPEHENEWLADLRKVGNFLKNGHADDKQTVTYELITTAEQFSQWLVVGLQENGGNGLLCLDTEWQGARPDTPGAYLRTLQLCFANGRTAVVRFYPTATPEQPVVPANSYPDCAGIKAVLDTLGLYLQAGGRVFGQNISADGYWLLHHGLDLRPYTTYDTMLAEHVLDNRGPFNLTDLTLKYAPELGRYDRWLQDWVNHNPDLVVGGYGAVPEELLFPYGAGDVQAPWQIARRQMPLLVQEGAMQRTGLRQEYPSLFEIEMNMALQLYELHLAGLAIDRQRLDELTALFNNKRDALRIQVGDMAAKNGFPDFNPNSHQQKVKLVYGAKSEGGLALLPIKSTGKRSKAWDWVQNQHPDVRAHYRPALDGETLDTMAGSHPLIDTLISYQRVGTICKNFLRNDEEGGIAGNLWPDGHIHSDFSQLTDTGRLRSARPNCFPGWAEVLTETGWTRFDCLGTARLAQYDMLTGLISFARPRARIVREAEQLVRLYTDMFVDLTVTADHDLVLCNRKTGALVKRQAAAAPVHSPWALLHGGDYVGGHKALAQEEIVFLCAYYADGSDVTVAGKLYGVDFSFSKPRKIRRLRAALDKLGMPFRQSLRQDGKTRFYVRPNPLLKRFRDDYGDGFGPWVLKLERTTFRRLAEEVWFWDGSPSRRSMFSSNIRTQADWVQIITTLVGRRAKVRRYQGTVNPNWQVDASNRCHSGLENAQLQRVARTVAGPEGKVYCVTMPKGTVIVRFDPARPPVVIGQCQNWPKASEGELRVIFKEERQQLEQAGKLEPKELWPPSIRSIVVAEPGCILLEADYKQAELFVLAGLAMDDVMLDALRVPGKDLHDMTTIQSFRIRIYNPDGTPYDEAQMLALAKADLPAFEKLQKELIYIDSKGKRMSRAEFKDTIRVSGKSVNFGIPYGRGPEAIARQVNAETGMNVSVDEIRNGIESWKQMFSKAWACMCRFREQALMQRYVATVWGRKRRFNRPENSGQQGQIEREGSNHPIQGTVADTIAIAMSRIAGLRRERGLTFKIINQIHDALLFSVPLGELAAAEEIVRVGMSEIDLPMPGGPLRLSVDIERFERWGEKTTKKG